MKKLLNQTTSILALLILVGVIGVFVFSLRNRTEALPNQELGQSSYPGPNANDPNVGLIDPYPAPANSTYSQSASCNEDVEWTTYTDSSVGYTLTYPQLYPLRESTSINGHKSLFIFLNSRCSLCQHGIARVEVRILENPDHLPIKEFVEQYFIDNSIARGESVEWVNSFDILDHGGAYAEVADTEAIRIQDTDRSLERIQMIGPANPMVFIPQLNRVILFSVGSNNDPEPPFNPCYEIVDAFDEILASLKLFNPGQ